MATDSLSPGPTLRVLALTQAVWGERIAEHVARFCPPNWITHRYALPRALPTVIDDPADYLPEQLPSVDLLLALGETPSAASLIPDVARLCGARAVIAPIDRNESLPPGLIGQLRGWLDELGVAVVFPKPFCSLTETTINGPPITQTYHDPLISGFARVFGRPGLKLSINTERCIAAVQVERHAACGCTSHIAEGLIGCPASEAVQRAGLLHHHFPCLASMNQDLDYHDTLMHVSGHLLQEVIKIEVQDHVEVAYLRPSGHFDD